jgi:hypothetical protein
MRSWSFRTIGRRFSLSLGERAGVRASFLLPRHEALIKRFARSFNYLTCTA